MSEQSEHQGPPDDGFPAEDVSPDDPDPEMDIADPFGVGADREPLEDEKDEKGGTQDEDGDGED